MIDSKILFMLMVVIVCMPKQGFAGLTADYSQVTKYEFDCAGRDITIFHRSPYSCHEYYWCVDNYQLAYKVTCKTSNIIFDEDNQTCNFLYNVDPPCGTKGTTTTEMP
uniref:uncharacterized protein LOC120327153 n=1 Tax=Styela clava TaxID=7725 RepID=UPI001939C6A2|nr:uncharacterized protein LOC120327153 [Styela clava]